MACSLARRAARLAIFVLRSLGQRSGNRSPKSKTPPQAEASAIDGQAEGEADRARGGDSTGDLISVGVRTPRTDKHPPSATGGRVTRLRRPGHNIVGRNAKFTLWTGGLSPLPAGRGPGVRRRRWPARRGRRPASSG